MEDYFVRVPAGMWGPFMAGLGDGLLSEDTRGPCPDCTVDYDQDPPVLVPCASCGWRNEGYATGFFLRQQLQFQGRRQFALPPINPDLPSAAGR